MREKIYLILSLLLLFQMSALASSQGPLGGGSFANVTQTGSSASWTNVSNAQFEDAIVTTVNIPKGKKYSDYLWITNFGFSIPNGFVINGIKVEIKRSANNKNIQDQTIQIIKGGVRVGTNKKVKRGWPGTLTYKTYGGITDLWGTTFTEDDINASNFGIAIAVINKDKNTTRTANIDYVRITVYYALVFYYSKSSGDLSLTTSWGRNTDGSGTAPSNFTGDGQIFTLRNRAAATLTANFTISGDGSEMIVGDGTTSINFTIPSSFSFNGTLSVSNNATATIQNTSLPSFDAIDDGSTVIYSAAGAQDVVAADYYNLTVSGSGTTKSLLSGDAGVRNNFNISSGVTFNNLYDTVLVSGPLSNSGSHAGSGELYITGASAQTISGTSGNLGNFEIDNDLGVTISTAQSFTGTLTLTNGSLSAGSLLTPNAGSMIIRDDGTFSGTLQSSNAYDVTYIDTSKTTGSELGGSGLRDLIVNLTNPTGQTLTLSGALALARDLTITSGTLDVSSSNYAVSFKGNFTNNGSFTPRSGTVTCNGTTSQIISGNALTFNNLTITNTAGVINCTNAAVNGTLTVNANAVLRPSSSSIISGTGTLTGSGTVQVTRTAATPDFNSQFTISNKTLTNLTVDYNGANQVLSNVTYGYLKISGTILPGTSNATVGAGLTVTGTFTPTGGTVTMNNGSSITNSGTLTFKNLTLPNSATVTTASSFNIDGTLNVGTSAVFNATNLAVTLKDNAGVTSSGAVNFSGLNIDRPVSGNITLNGSATVNGTLDLINGSITLGTYNITMGSGASFNNVSSTKYIVTDGSGVLTRNNVGSSSVLFPVGTASSYNPVSIVNNGTFDNFSVRVQTTFDNPPVDPTKVVNRQWTVTEAVPGGSSALLSFQFNSGEWASNFSPLGSVNIGRWNGSAWVAYAGDISGSGPYTITSNGGAPITSFSPFGVGNDGSLPVLLSYFNSNVTARNIKLNWGTTIEIDNRGFDIERSDIAKPNWVKIGFVEGHGTSNESHDYSFTDQKLNSGTYNYRLKQIDYNGNFEYFYLFGDATVNKPADYFVSQNYPNPSNPNSKIDYQLPFDAKVTIKLYDLLGREVAAPVDKLQQAGYYTETIDGSNLASGIYIYRFTATGGNQSFAKTMKMILLK
jgi:type IX secretion system substrate protein